jgi:catechol 2,3-dioxygenase-like lactoylglutathione lyase family enzyme
MKKLTLLFLLLGFSEFIIAQENALFSVTFNHVALSVKDVNRSAEFYKKTLNFEEITNRSKKEGRRWLSLGEGKELHLIAATNLNERVVDNNKVHFALTALGFDYFIKKLESMNIKYFDWQGIPNKIKIRADGVKQIYFQDPDGYWIEVNSDI